MHETTVPLLTIRPGTSEDVDAVTLLHGACSPASLYRRFHAPLPLTSGRFARALLTPEGGWSLLAALGGNRDAGGRVVGMACAGPLSSLDLEIGLVVADAHQGRGIGARLVAEVAAEATVRGYRALHCLTQPDNEGVLGTLAKAGLRFEPARGDGLLRVRVPLAAETGLARPA